MRVVLDVSAVPTRPVGAGVYTIALAQGLAARDMDLHLVARRSDADRWQSIAPGAHLHARAPDARPLRLAWEQTGALRLAREISADVWHGPHYTMPLRLNTPAVVTVHDLTFFDHPEWHERSKVAYFRGMIRAAARRARVLVCVSAHTAARLQAIVEPSCDIVVAPHGVDHRWTATTQHNEAEDRSRLAAHGISSPYIAFAGTIEPRKDVPTLVDAFARVARVRPELRLVVAGGDGWGAAAASRAIAASGVATRVLRPGYVDDETLAALFRRAAAVAYPSQEEGFGLPALEALACATPLVTTKGSALEEVVGDAALLVQPRDAPALADALASVLDDPAVDARLRAAGPARAAQFTWERSVGLHVDAYERATATSVSR